MGVRGDLGWISRPGRLHGPRSEAGNLGSGWVGFDFAAAFGKPVKMINDAAMQALGSYEGGRMLFLGLGTGLGSTFITGHMIIPLELGRMIYDAKRTLGDVLGRQGQRRLGKSNWRKAVTRVVTALMHAFLADYVVVGGGNAKNVEELPPGVRRGHNLTAFRGGARLWSVEDVWVLAAPGEELSASGPARTDTDAVGDVFARRGQRPCKKRMACESNCRRGYPSRGGTPAAGPVPGLCAIVARSSPEVD